MRPLGILLAFGVAAAATPALAHHSIAAMYDRDKTVEIEGVLSKFELINPHSLLEITVPERGGRSTVWALETRGVGGMTRMGFDASMVAVGDKVKVKGSPARSGEKALWLVTLETGAGKSYDFSLRNR